MVFMMMGVIVPATAVMMVVMVLVVPRTMH